MHYANHLSLVTRFSLGLPKSKVQHMQNFPNKWRFSQWALSLSMKFMTSFEVRHFRANGGQSRNVFWFGSTPNKMLKICSSINERDVKNEDGIPLNVKAANQGNLSGHASMFGKVQSVKRVLVKKSWLAFRWRFFYVTWIKKAMKSASHV